MKRLITTILLALIAPTIILAATPSIDTSYNQTTTTIQPGNQTSIQITTTHNGYQPTIIPISQPQNLTTEQYNTLQNTQSNTITANTPSNTIQTLPQGSELQLLQQGTYTLQSQNTSYNITVNPPTIPRIQHTVKEDQEKLLDSIQPDTYTIQEGETEKTEITLKAQKNLQAGDYQTIIQTNNTRTNTTVNQETIQTTIPETTTYTADDQLPSTVETPTPSNQRIGNITINNTGNTDTTITQNITGNASQYIQSLKETTLFTDQTLTLSYIANIPAQTKTGLQNYTITIQTNDTTKTYNKTINITDAQPPTIQNITLSGRNAGTTQRLEIQASDNNALGNATITYDDQTQTIPPKGETYTSNITIRENQTAQTLQATITDTEGNQAQQNKTITPTRTTTMKIDNTIQTPTVKPNEPSETTLLQKTTNTETQPTITLTSLTTTNNADTTLRITAPDSNTETIELNQTHRLNKIGNYTVTATSDNVSEYTAIFQTTNPSYADPTNQTITVNGNTAEYSIPDEMETEVQGIEWDCEPRDTGNLETSAYLCDVTYPATSNLNNPSTIVTKSRLEEQEQTINDVKSTNSTLSALLVALGIAFIITLVSAYIVNKYFRENAPYVRYKG